MNSMFFATAILALSQFTSASTFLFPENTDLTKQLGCTPLRILCLGDSITQGSLSSSGDGYRGYLQSLLINSTNGGAYGADVDFVGTLRRGNMTDNSHDGDSGAYLANISSLVQPAIQSLPNVVLIHAGSNDMDKDVDISTAIDRLESIVRDVHDGSPNATIFLAQIIISKSASMQNRTDAFNPQIATLVETLRAAPNNFDIVDVNMSRILTSAMISDYKHPNDEGYAVMARTWYDAIANATTNGLVQAPVEISNAEPSLGLGLDGSPLTPNITCRLSGSATSTTAPGAASTSGGSVTASGGSAATSVSSRGVATDIILVSTASLRWTQLDVMLSGRSSTLIRTQAPASWLAFLLSFAVALTP